MKTIRIVSIAYLCILLSGCHTSKKVADSNEIIIIHKNKPEVKKPDSIQIKYAQELHVSPDSIKNIRLYKFIDEWLHTPYKWGGTDKRGIDCSAFIQRLLLEVYQINIPRTSDQQFFARLTERFRMSKYASEGDLVFFRTMDHKIISHVGLYLQNNKFVNSSSSKGVSIASLNDPYWKKRYIAAGRIKSGVQNR